MNRETRKAIESAFYNYEKYEDMKSAKEGYRFNRCKLLRYVLGGGQ